MDRTEEGARLRDDTGARDGQGPGHEARDRPHQTQAGPLRCHGMTESPRDVFREWPES